MSGRNSATGNRPLRVLFDGWALAACPESPAAIHLLELLEAIPPGVEAWLALPGEAEHLPSHPDMRIAIRAVGLRRPLAWEQVDLPALVRSTGASLLHVTSPRLPLFSPVPCLVSPAALLGVSGVGAGRLVRAMGRGGLARAAGLLWPEDLPPPTGWPGIPLLALPPRVHGEFSIPQPRPAGLPEDYIYVPGPLPEGGLCVLYEIWRQIAAALGEACGLLVSGLPQEAQARLAGINSEVQVVSLPAASPSQRAAFYQHAAAALVLSPVLPWGDALLQALACACPLAAEETTLSDHRSGPAAYLTPPGDARLLASALATLVLENSVSLPLRQAARQRAAAWGRQDFTVRLGQVYRQVSAL